MKYAIYTNTQGTIQTLVSTKNLLGTKVGEFDTTSENTNAVLFDSKEEAQKSANSIISKSFVGLWIF